MSNRHAVKGKIICTEDEWERFGKPATHVTWLQRRADYERDWTESEWELSKKGNLFKKLYDGTDWAPSVGIVIIRQLAGGDFHLSFGREFDGTMHWNDYPKEFERVFGAKTAAMAVAKREGFWPWEPRGKERDLRREPSMR